MIENMHDISGVEPLMKLENGQAESVSSQSSSSTYSVKRVDDHYCKFIPFSALCPSQVADHRVDLQLVLA